MAVTNQKSTQRTNQTASPQVVNPASDEGGRVRIAYFSHTQNGAGDATSTVELVKVPGGRLRIYEIVTQHSALGASRTLDHGFAAYADNDEQTVAADPDAFGADHDASAAGGVRLAAPAQLTR